LIVFVSALGPRALRFLRSPLPLCRSGKSHLAAATGLALIDNEWRALFMRTSDLVQRLQVARRELALESAIAKLDKISSADPR
jgi:hypothetical protein